MVPAVGGEPEVAATTIHQDAPRQVATTFTLHSGAWLWSRGPIVKMLLDQGAQVVANDISTKQIEMAKVRCPGATLIAGDMTTILTFESASFHGVISFYTLFHLPRSKLKAMLAKIHGWLKPGGVFVFNLATIDEEEIHGEFLGYGMYWSSYGVDENRAILTEVGFEVLQVEVLQAGDGKLEEDDPDFDAEFMWVMARKNTKERIFYVSGMLQGL